jgi:UDP-glucose 4-epimerase
LQLNRILVTGASGFIGRSLSPALDRAGYFVRTASRQTGMLAGAHESVTISDLTRPIAWQPIVDGMDAVVHLAAMAHTMSKSPDALFDRVNWIATQELVSAARACGVKHFIFISSIRAQSAAYADRVLSEADEPRPSDAYGRSKLGAEQAVRDSGIPFTIFRPVVVYGPDPKGNIATLLRVAGTRWPLPLPLARFDNRRSLLAMNNLIDGIIFSLNQHVTIGQLYLIADDDALSLTEIFTILREAYGRKRQLISVPPKAFELLFKAIGREDYWHRLAGNLIVSTNKLRRDGWRPKIDTRSGLVDLVRTVKGESARQARNAGGGQV